MDLSSCRELYIGVDIGRTHDLTVIWILEKVGGLLLTRKVITMKKTAKPDQEKVLWPLIELPNVQRVCIDSTGLGIGWVDDAQRRFGKYRVEGVNFTQGVKEKLAYPVRGAMEDRRLKIPFDPVIRADLRAVSKVTTPSGNIRFTAERTAAGHADRFWGLALAVEAASTPNQVPITCTVI